LAAGVGRVAAVGQVIAVTEGRLTGITMRLFQHEQTAITDAVWQVDKDAQIYLFGSRVNDTAKGGDIDVLVLSKKINLMAKLGILAQLHLQLGERKIDVTVYPDASRPFPRMVMREGIRL
jgi:predicted nucleotidyltransferase